MNSLTFNKRFLVKVFVFVLLIFLVGQCYSLSKGQSPHEIHTNSSMISKTFGTELKSKVKLTENGHQNTNKGLKDEISFYSGL